MNSQTPDARRQGPVFDPAERQITPDVDVRTLPRRVRDVLAIAAEENRVTVAMILSRNKHASVAKARRQTCQTLRRMGFSFPQIGRFIGRHHTSVFYSTLKPPVVDPKRYELTVPDLSGEWAI